jgi:hypothetical protein
MLGPLRNQVNCIRAVRGVLVPTGAYVLVGPRLTHKISNLILSGPSTLSFRTIAGSNSRFLRCGLLRPARIFLGALRDIPLICTSRESGSLFIAGDFRLPFIPSRIRIFRIAFMGRTPGQPW